MWLLCSVFFSKQKTAYEIPKRDWSSDVCSSDLVVFADCDSLLGNNRQSIGVHVLRETNVSVVVLHRRAEIAEVFRNGLRRTRKRSVGRDVDGNHFSAERL